MKDDYFEKSRQLAEDVEERVQAGKSRAARMRFSKTWRESVPELPLQFSVILEDLNHDVAISYIKRLRNKKAQELKLNRISKGKIEVVEKRKKEALGLLPQSDSELLFEFKKSAKLYKPKLLEVKTDDEGNLDYVAILVWREDDNDQLLHFHDAFDNIIRKEDS